MVRFNIFKMTSAEAPASTQKRSCEASYAHNTVTEPPETMNDIYSAVPKKARSNIKRTLKKKHIYESEMCDRVQWIIKWITMVCTDVFLPAFFVCLKEEQMTKKFEELSTELTADQRQMLQESTKEASWIGDSIFVTMMQCLRNSMSESKCPLEDVMTSERSLETIPMFQTDLINCVYLELLANGMGKKLPVQDLEDNAQSWLLRWEFHMSVLQYFCQRAAWHHVGIFLGLPHTLQDDLGGLMTKMERTTLNALTKLVTDRTTDVIREIAEDPLWIAELFGQGWRSVIPDADVETSCFEEPEEEDYVQTFLQHNNFTEPPLTIKDIYSAVPKKARKNIDRTLKEKHIYKIEMCDRVQQTIKWIKLVCTEVVLPALVVCLKEELMTTKAKELLPKLTVNYRHMLHESTKEASLIGESIFVSMMQCKRNKTSSAMPEAKCSLEDAMTSVRGLETIQRFKKDFINCVYLELLANGMGKTFPVVDAQAISLISRWELYVSVLQYFCQRAAWHHMELFLGLPHTLQDDLGGSMTKTERTTLNALTKMVMDNAMDVICETVQDPLWIATIIKQGEGSVNQDADLEICSLKDFDEEEQLSRNSPKPATPESHTVSSSTAETDQQPSSTQKEKKRRSFFSRIRGFFSLRKPNQVAPMSTPEV